MIINLKVKNAIIFLVISILLLRLNLGNLNNGFTLVSFAQETGETVEAGEAQETTATNEAVETEEEELDISLKADYITYEKIDEEDLVIAKDGVELKYQDIEIKADYLKINLDTNLLFASGEVLFKQD
ncbi:unnamed protein product, partial [marine sediment metagenome]